METLPNLCFAGFYNRLGKYSKDLEKYDQGILVATKFEVVTKDLANHQFLSHDLSKHVATNTLDKDLRSRQRIEVTTRSDTGAKRRMLR